MKSVIDRVCSIDSQRVALITEGGHHITYAGLLRGPSSAPSSGWGAGESAWRIWRLLETLRSGVGVVDLGDEDVDVGTPPASVAYIGRSSGSTGTAKRITVPESVFVPCLEHWVEQGILRPDDRVLLVHPPSFDPWLLDVLATLAIGGTLLCAPSVVDYVRFASVWD
jgi:non-ribosomal peptide synthetase component F